MGGSGSGNWYRWNSKTTTESQHTIDIRYLKKHGGLTQGRVGALTWSRWSKQTGVIAFAIQADCLHLNYRYRKQREDWEDVKQIIPFERTPCNYGGFRTWFLCPECQKRVVLLYGVEKLFLCRHCYGLTYASQQEGVPERLMRRARKIRERLGASANLMEPILFKPRNMHCKTFSRLPREADQASIRSLKIIGRQFGIK